MIIQGSMRYSPSGRKRKTNAYKKKAQPKFVAQKTKNFKTPDTTSKIPSLKTSSKTKYKTCLLYTSPSPRDGLLSRMPSSA